MDNEAPRRPRVALCIPAYDSWKCEMGFDALRLAIYSAPQVDLVACFIRGQDTSEARNSLVDALRGQPKDDRPDALLWIDADMRFPPDALIRLLQHRVPIVGADYRVRHPPYPRMGMWFDPADPFKKYFPVPDDGPTTGLDDRMAMLGFGLILTHLRVFESWPRPWFVRGWHPENKREGNPSGFITEDCLWCTMARASGYKIHCDLDLSAEVSHIGQMTVPWQIVGAAKGLP